MFATGMISLTYFSQKPATPPLGFWLLWAAIAAGITLGSFWRATWTPTIKVFNPRAVVCTGALFLPLLLLCSGAFAHGLPFPLFASVWALIVCLSGRSATRAGADGVLLLGLGAYTGMGAMNIIVSHPIAKVVGALAFAIIVLCLRKNQHLFPPPHNAS